MARAHPILSTSWSLIRMDCTGADDPTAVLGLGDDQCSPRERAERRFIAQIRESGRWMEWGEVTQCLAEGKGTLIVEQGTDIIKYFPLPRCWWTDEDVPALARCKPPPMEDVYFVQFNEQVHPFAEWCSERYLDGPRGLAKLTQAEWSDDDEDAILGGRIFAAELLKTRFPNARIVTTAFWKRRCRRCGYDLRASPDRCPECGTVVT